MQLYRGWVENPLVILYPWNVLKLFGLEIFWGSLLVSGPNTITRVHKYARNGQTSYKLDSPLYTFSGIFFSTPENTKTFKDSIKIDQVRAKTVKTRFVRGST